MELQLKTEKTPPVASLRMYPVHIDNPVNNEKTFSLLYLVKVSMFKFVKMTEMTQQRMHSAQKVLPCIVGCTGAGLSQSRQFDAVTSLPVLEKTWRLMGEQQQGTWKNQQQPIIGYIFL